MVVHAGNGDPRELNIDFPSRTFPIFELAQVELLQTGLQVVKAGELNECKTFRRAGLWVNSVANRDGFQLQEVLLD